MTILLNINQMYNDKNNIIKDLNYKLKAVTEIFKISQ